MTDQDPGLRRDPAYGEIARVFPASLFTDCPPLPVGQLVTTAQGFVNGGLISWRSNDAASLVAEQLWNPSSRWHQFGVAIAE